MFDTLIRMPMRVAALGARDHALLNRRCMPRISAAMAEGDWTCHVCEIRLPGFMEIDHLDGHRPSDTRLAPICQFCHDRKHPLWAASRGRITLIHAPDFTHEQLSRLAWTILLHRGQKGAGFDRKRLLRDLEARREDALDAIGHTNLEALLEVLLSMGDILPAARMAKLTAELDADIRVVPAALFSEEPDLRAWSGQGLMPVAEGWAAEARPANFPDYAMLAKIGRSLTARL